MFSKPTPRPVPDRVLPVRRRTASHVAVLSDRDYWTRMDIAGANTFTIPPDVFPVGSVLNGSAAGAGQTTLTAGAGVSITGAGGTKTNGQYSVWSAYQVTRNVWVVYGRLTT